jgi:16S rRNA (cytosine1402-N4)-methyltransferase
VSDEFHVPVLLDEVLELLDPQPGEIYVDGTTGGGGHAAEMAAKLAPGGTAVLIDQDVDALALASKVVSVPGVKIVPVHGNFGDIEALLDAAGTGLIDMLLLDLGVSSHQLDTAERGFSFRYDAPLDSRMNAQTGRTAADVVNEASEVELERILREYGEERFARGIARRIVDRRKTKRIETTGEFAELVASAQPKPKFGAIHPATRSMQALRIQVNDELGVLTRGLEAGVRRLAVGGRIGIISYHSLEDRIVKQSFARLAGQCQCPPGLPICICGAKAIIERVTRKPVIPSQAEIDRNPRSRSAKLRVARKLAA